MSSADDSLRPETGGSVQRWRAFQRAFGGGLNNAFDVPKDNPEDDLVDLLRMADARRSEPPQAE